MNSNIIYLGGGCFWCVEAVFKRIPGILDMQSGYMGGTIENPTYNQVCMGNTGHVEVIRLEFDPKKISLKGVLEVFFLAHDPTSMNKQGNDVGEQYKSVIFYNNNEQKEIAKDLISELQKNYRSRIVTALEPAPKFYMAEDYHQDYFARNPNQPYCAFVIAEKLKKLSLL